ncbi:aldo/keto reductase [Schaalia suimastitidis]|uniref:aldo/keto reductase n=1 Tax=Schaalia suimastitidis TaxID=121163 RepID=UPI000417B03A|nr:aldo/keto reductase [Schaalia suimastitidis]
MAVQRIPLNDATSIPQVGFGVFLVPEEITQACVEEALAAGYRHIDTASIYGNEAAVGRAIAASGLSRDEIYVTTKLWNSDQGVSARSALEASLERLGLDCVDLYLIHWPVPSKDLYLDSWQALECAADDGLTTSIGVSNFLPEHLDRIAALGGRIPVVNQIELHPMLQQANVTAANRRLNIATQAWSPLGRGAALELPEVCDVARRNEITPAQAILAWHIARGNIVIPKSVTPERIRENLEAASVTLDNASLAVFDALEAGIRIGPDPATFEG